MPELILNNNQVRKVILNGRTYFGRDNNNIKDVLNHGDVVGLNPLYGAWQAKNGAASYWSFYNETQDRLYRPGGSGWSDNSAIVLSYPILNTQYSSIFFEVEVPEGKDGLYNHFEIGYAIKNDSFYNRLQNSVNLQYGGQLDSGSYSLIRYDNNYNILNNDPWYTLPRHIFKVEVPTTQEFFYFISWAAGFETAYVYSIWLEL